MQTLPEVAGPVPKSPSGRPVERLDHVILTRFNLPSAGHEGLVRAQENWLRDRVALFERYCLPSVRAQTCQDFTWIVYFDPQSPRWLLEWASEHRARGDFHVIYRDSVPHAVLLEDIRAALPGDPGDALLTTNLDNDDSLARDFVARLQEASHPAERAAVYVGDGLIVQGERLYRRLDPHNAFCSVRETWSSPVTCWADWHNLLPNRMPAVVLRGDPGWLQVVHGRNVSNRVRGRQVAPTAFRRGFAGLLDGLPDPRRAELARDALLAVPSRAVRDGVRAAAKFVVGALLGREGLDRAKRLWASARS
jgi:hypothetical protein